MVFKLLVVIASIGLVSCTGPMNRKGVDGGFGAKKTTSLALSRISVTFDYDASALKPWRDRGLAMTPNIVSYALVSGTEENGEMVINVIATPVGFIPEMSAASADRVGSIGSKISTLEEVCDEEMWKPYIISNCHVKEAPNRAELVIASPWPGPGITFGMPSKVAFYLTKDEKFPGLIVALSPHDLPEAFLFTETEEEMYKNLEKMARGNIKSNYEREFEKVMTSIRFAPLP